MVETKVPSLTAFQSRASAFAALLYENHQSVTCILNYQHRKSRDAILLQ